MSVWVYILPRLYKESHTPTAGKNIFEWSRPTDSLSDTFSDIISDILSDTVSVILSNIYSDISSGILSGILFGILTDSNILSGDHGWGPAAHWDRAQLAVTRRRSRRDAEVIKPRDLHLAGGEKSAISFFFAAHYSYFFYPQLFVASLHMSLSPKNI